MAQIELPRALEDYFAFAETAPTRNGRRFVLSLPYFCGTGAGAKLDRLQWWFHMSPEQERQMGEAAISTLRAQATERFRKHIERWLQNTGQKIYGDEPIPNIGSLIDTAADESAAVELPASEPVSSVDASAEAGACEAPAEVMSWPAERVANG